MTTWDAALWGLLGAAVAEAFNLSASMRPRAPGQGWTWPWTARGDLVIAAVAVGLRLFVGCGLAAPLAASDLLPTPFSAFLAGLAAPLMIARIFQQIPVAAEPAGSPSADPSVPPADPAAPPVAAAADTGLGAVQAAARPDDLIAGQGTPDAAG